MARPCRQLKWPHGITPQWYQRMTNMLQVIEEYVENSALRRAFAEREGEKRRWRPLLESNQHLALRRGLFYPLN